MPDLTQPAIIQSLTSPPNPHGPIRLEEKEYIYKARVKQNAHVNHVWQKTGRLGILVSTCKDPSLHQFPTR